MIPVNMSVLLRGGRDEQVVAELLDGARIEQSDFYQPTDDAATEDVDESESAQLTVVIGLDHTDSASEETPAP